MSSVETRPLERGAGLSWILWAVIIFAAVAAALQLQEQTPPAAYQPDRAIAGLQHKKPSPCLNRDSANCVPIKP